MTTFKKVFEAFDNIDQVVKTIESDCQPFLKNLGVGDPIDKLFELADRRPRNGLMRGYKIDGTFFAKTARDDRQPLDTSPRTHEVVDQWFFDRFRFRYRSSGVFCTNKYSTARGYGTPYLVFPVGNYTACWSDKITDLYSVLKRESVAQRGTLNDDIVDRIQTILEGGEYKQQPITFSELDRHQPARSFMGSSGTEFMVAVKSYYLVSFELVDVYNVSVKRTND
jgi:hypothetical protein